MIKHPGKVDSSCSNLQFKQSSAGSCQQWNRAYVPGDVKPLSEARFFPVFDEKTVFLMSLTFMLLGVLDPDLRHLLRGTGISIVVGTGLALLFVVSLAVSALNVLISRPKFEFEKKILVSSGVLITLIVGTCATLKGIEASAGVFLVFPIWNLFCVASFLWIIDAKDYIEKSFSDRDVSFKEILISLIILSWIMSTLCIVFSLHWTMVYAVCLSSIAFLERLSNSLFDFVPNTLSVSESIDGDAEDQNFSGMLTRENLQFLTSETLSMRPPVGLDTSETYDKHVIFSAIKRPGARRLSEYFRVNRSAQID